ncbi:ATP-binding cassette domain-containing protein [Actinomadura harenae]|uniref:ATP-binding cassette domain-containing protein n=1 Tax=Actinomadura harenae TaxID=2483351 RepID=A0A3M2L9Y1_9ACTN|nr:ATP-binding cassette domain-containing protein [Actinomadura harenae]RMI33856.1 ATP-binding cassette domain-containing protein [Actinomadura harenae]
MAPASDLAIETSGLVKTFGETRAVDGVDLAVRPGTVQGFLGPNGAGKTTTIRVLATLLHPDSGTARVCGHDVVREAATVRSKVSLTGQFASVDEDLSGSDNLFVLARLLGYRPAQARDRSAELLTAFGLEEQADVLVKNFSGGLRRRLDVAASLVVRPDVLFLDEPTTGLDPVSRSRVWAVVRAIVDTGTTVVLTTQYLEEADRLADRIAVIDRGRIIADGTSDELKASVGANALRVRLRDPEQRETAVRVLERELGPDGELTARASRGRSPGGESAQETAGTAEQAGETAGSPGGDPAALTIRVTDGGDGKGVERATRALAELTREGVALADFTFERPSLDEVFLALTGHHAETRGKAGKKGHAAGSQGGRDGQDGS